MKLLVLGGTGMLGHKVFQILSVRYPQTFCTIRPHKHEAKIRNVQLLQSDSVIDGVDAADWGRVAGLLSSLQPDVVVNCVGVIKQRPSAEDAIVSITLNSLFPHRLAKTLSQWGGRLIHISTDCVFSGIRGKYREEDPSDALDLYGRSKYLGEVDYLNAVTLRTSIIGREIFHKASLLEWFLAQNGRKVKGYTHAIYSGLTTIELSKVICRVIENESLISGVWHVAGPVISKYELLRTIRETFRVSVDIEPYDDFVCDRSLLGDKFREETGYCSPDWREMLWELVNDSTPYAQWV